MNARSVQVTIRLVPSGTYLFKELLLYCTVLFSTGYTVSTSRSGHFWNKFDGETEGGETVQRAVCWNPGSARDLRNALHVPCITNAIFGVEIWSSSRRWLLLATKLYGGRFHPISKGPNNAVDMWEPCKWHIIHARRTSIAATLYIELQSSPSPQLELAWEVAVHPLSRHHEKMIMGLGAKQAWPNVLWLAVSINPFMINNIVQHSQYITYSTATTSATGLSPMKVCKVGRGPPWWYEWWYTPKVF